MRRPAEPVQQPEDVEGKALARLWPCFGHALAMLPPLHPARAGQSRAAPGRRVAGKQRWCCRRNTVQQLQLLLLLL